MSNQLQQYILARVVTNLGTGCWDWVMSKNKAGYGRVKSSLYSAYGKQLAHQLSFIAWKGVYPKELHILHSCHNPSCCNPQHLRTGTNSENMQDMVVAGRSNKGEAHGRSKLTDADVKCIKTLLGSMRGKDIAAMFDVSAQQISYIKTGRTWRIK